MTDGMPLLMPLCSFSKLKSTRNFFEKCKKIKIYKKKHLTLRKNIGIYAFEKTNGPIV